MSIEETMPDSTTNKSGEVRMPHCLLGALAGDMIGAPFEFERQKSTDFPLFSVYSTLTDDSILTLAVAEAIMNDCNYLKYIRKYALAYPNSGYGLSFRSWMYSEDPQPYNSFGNGSAMRVSAVGWAFNTIEDVLREAEASAVVTHNHPEGIKGAQATALSIYLARKGVGKKGIKEEVASRFGYDLSKTIEEIRPTYEFNETCQETVPQAITAFMESQDFEDAIRIAISLGGDADTLAAIAGSIAEAYYGGVPEEIANEVKRRTPNELWRVVDEFNKKFCGQAG